jgi:hypothetical protein
LPQSEHDGENNKANQINAIGAERVKVAFAHGGFHTLRDETTPSAMALERADRPYKKA